MLLCTTADFKIKHKHDKNARKREQIYEDRAYQRTKDYGSENASKDLYLGKKEENDTPKKTKCIFLLVQDSYIICNMAIKILYCT